MIQLVFELAQNLSNLGDFLLFFVTLKGLSYGYSKYVRFAKIMGLLTF